MIYINSSGASLTKGLVENAPQNKTDEDLIVGDWGPYDNPDLPEVIAIIREHFSPYKVCIASELPSVPDYDMVVLQNATYNNQPNFVSFGLPPDCGNTKYNGIQVVVVADEANLGVPTKAIAISLQAAKRFFGLESVTNALDDIMNQFIGSTNNGASFTDTCYLKVNAPICDTATDGGCAPNEQASGPYLLQKVGPA